MKKGLVYSFVAISLMLSSSALNADVVLKKEAKALSNPKMTFGDASAKAKVEEAQNKLMFESKIDAKKFREDALKDKNKRLSYSVTKEVNLEKKGFKKTPKEIVEAFSKMVEAIKAIQNQDLNTAKTRLEEASKDFEKVLKANPDLELVPIANEIEVKSFGGDPKLIKNIINSANVLLNKHDTQAARALLIPLVDEIDITTELIPMDIYPVAAKDAKKALDKGDEIEALAILGSAFNAVVVDSVVIPIPLLVSSNLVIAASQLDKSKKREATALLDTAQKELEKAILLGYTKKYSPEYQALISDIKAIKKEIKGKNVVEKLYEKLKSSFEKLLGKTRKDVVRNRAEEKVNSYEKVEEKKALKESGEFQKEAKEDMKKTVK